MSRAQRRLEIARDLMGLAIYSNQHGPVLHWSEVLPRIQAMPEDKREALRECVDWVEDYERKQ